MTLRIQQPGWPDQILSMLGKRRAVLIPPMSAQYGYYIARRENFLRAFFRSSSKPPPAGWIYWDKPDIERNTEEGQK
jgi:hypothetical protein